MVGQQNGSLAVVKPPFATGVTPSFIIAPTTINAAQATEALNSTFDSAGNLWTTYGGDDGFPGQAGVAEYAQPFSCWEPGAARNLRGLGLPVLVAVGP